MDTIVYRVGEKLYINLTNRCSNNCEFCIRREGDGAYGSDSLWLKCEPTADEVIAALKAHECFKDCREVVFCGYGEPTYRMQEIVQIGQFLRTQKKTSRINTNGQANLINGRDVSGELAGSVDIINVSLNSPTAAAYQKLCHSVYGEAAFVELIDFARKCRENGARVIMSVVDVIGQENVELCRQIAEQAGVEYRVRKYD